MGISAFGVFYGMMEKQSESKTYGFYSMVGLACCGFLPMIISTICKMRDIETKLKIIRDSHQHLASDMKNMLPSEVSGAESQSASSRTASEPEMQPLIPHPQNSQPPPPQLPRSTSFQDMMQQPLPMENFWWRYVVPTYTIGLFAMLYAIYVPFFG
ncbi:hypothetical protein AQUCO_05800218v1 [Aquilegia coerulea]|uniref:Uncharacterized protein n=1 Tax=Aquilegia coerulea TaxID=218851 RepID=A0A2G5CFB5_AQUCA|nr:hypothetical protein AQUCO_05800218v1 [Aquilegia coerulea]